MFDKIIRKHILSLKPYSSARDEYTGTIGIFLDANENPFTSVVGKKYNRYPDPHQKEIKTKLAKLKATPPNTIFIGNGSDEPIDLLIRACCEPKKDNIVILPPTYGMYQVCAEIHQVEIKKAPLTSDFQLDETAIEKVVDKHTKIIWICSPNNPSGNLIEESAIINTLKKYPSTLVVVDEAYIDFASRPSMISQLAEFENLVVLQTFSKAWGMAGLRVGVCYANSTLIAVLDKIKYPYNMNMLTQKIVLKALKKVGKKEKMVKTILENKAWLEKKLAKIVNVTKINPSDSNQVLVKFNNAKELFDFLIERKIITRDRTTVHLCEDSIRISIGKKKELKVLLEEIKDFYKQND